MLVLTGSKLKSYNFKIESLKNYKINENLVCNSVVLNTLIIAAHINKCAAF